MVGSMLVNNNKDNWIDTSNSHIFWDKLGVHWKVGYCQVYLSQKQRN